MERRSWHEDLTDAAKPHLKDGFWIPVYLMPGNEPVADPGGHYNDAGRAARRACHQANRRGAEAVYVVGRRSDRLELHATAARSADHDGRWRSHRDPFENGPLHIARILTSTQRGRLSALAA